MAPIRITKLRVWSVQIIGATNKANSSKATLISLIVALFVSVPRHITLVLDIAFAVARSTIASDTQPSSSIGYQLIFLTLDLNIAGVVAWSIFATMRLVPAVVKIDSVRK